MPQVTSTNLKMVGKLSSGLTTMKYDIAISFYIAPQAHRLCRHARSELSLPHVHKQVRKTPLPWPRSASALHLLSIVSSLPVFYV